MVNARQSWTGWADGSALLAVHMCVRDACIHRYDHTHMSVCAQAHMRAQTNTCFPDAVLWSVSAPTGGHNTTPICWMIFQLVSHIFLERNSHLSFDELNHAYGMHELCANAGDTTAFILYGTPTPFLRDGDNLNMDIRGLVFRPRMRRHTGTLTVEL